MRLGFNDLRGRMTLMFVGLLLLVQVATLSLTNYLGARMAAERFLPALEEAQAALSDELAQWERSLAAVARSFERAPALRRAVSQHTWDDASRLLGELAQRQRAELALFFDETGRLVAASEPVALPPSERIPVATEGRGGRSAASSRLVLMDARGHPVLLALVPFEGTGRHGFVGVGRRLERSLAQGLGETRRVELTVIASAPDEAWHVVSSTVAPERVAALERDLGYELSALGVLAGLSPFDLREFENRVVSLPAVGGSVAIVVQQSLGSALAPFEALRTSVAWVTLLGMIVFLLGSRLIASSITRPVRDLASAASRIRRGDYDQAIQTRAPGELAALAESLESMREEIARREGEVRRLAYYDSLTGLANRALFGVALRDAIAKAEGPTDDQGSRRFAILLLDLDRFKWVNDTLGHEVGDRVLEVAAERLRGAMPEGQMIARLGGDEFAILIGGAERPVHEFAERIGKALEPPIEIAEHTVDVGASIGIAHYPEHGETSTELMRHADAAMYTAKRQGIPSAVFDPALETNRVRHLSMLSDLRAALDRQEMELHVQPKIALTGGRPRIAGEVLVRWQHPERGMLPPSDFIPFAEQTGFIRQMTQYLLQRAIAQSARWLRSGLEVSLSVNVSARDLEDRSFSHRIARWLALESLPPRLLCLELTETALMEEPERAVAVLRDLRTIGVQVAIDDYGTGFSSLAYLRTLWVSELKIDQAFVRAMAHSERDATIVRSTIELGHSLGLKVTAEGVESAREEAMLREFGCDDAQGHHFSPPLTGAHFEQWAFEQHAALTGQRGPVGNRAQPVRASRRAGGVYSTTD